MRAKRGAATIALPQNWKRSVKSTVLHVISLAHWSITYTRGWATNSINARVRLKAENDRLLRGPGFTLASRPSEGC